MKETIALLTTHPFMGKPTDVKSMRRLVVASHYWVFYEVTTDLIVILLVWDCRRDPGQVNMFLD